MDEGQVLSFALMEVGADFRGNYEIMRLTHQTIGQ